ncbi:MAG: translocation/assembly module TamB domain-containing protein [Bacteroides sp.]
MKRTVIRWAVRIALTPVLLFVILMVLLYIPPVQNLLCGIATSTASRATGMQITAGRIDLRFPLNLLVTDVTVVQAPDTLLAMGSLNIRVQALPLFRGKVEVDDITLHNATVNSAHLLQGMRLRGVLGHFTLRSHGIDLRRQTVVINRAELTNTHLHLTLRDTTETPADTASVPLRWKINLQEMKLANVSVHLTLPADSLRMATRIGTATMEDAHIDLGSDTYGFRQFRLAAGSVRYDEGRKAPVRGLDPAHIALRNIRMDIDSVLYHGRSMNAVLRQASMDERSGLAITSLTGRIQADNSLLRIPTLRLLTPHSEVNFAAQTYWELIDVPTTGRLGAQFTALIGKQDLMLASGAAPDDATAAFWAAYPFRPLMVRASTDGNLKQLQLSRFSVNLPGAFALSGKGELRHLADSLKRSGSADLRMQTADLDFLTTLITNAAKPTANTFILPNQMELTAHLGMDGPHYQARLDLHDGEGRVNAQADFDARTQTYRANLAVEALQLTHFLPRDSLYELSASASASGKGLDFRSRHTTARLTATLDELHYAHYYLSDITLAADLHASSATARLTSGNDLLGMTATADYNLAAPYPDGQLTMDVSHIDLYELRLAPRPMKRPLAFHFEAEARKATFTTRLRAGDLHLDLEASQGLQPFLRQSTHFAHVLQGQIDDRLLDHKALRQALPSALFSLSAGEENPLAWYLATKDIGYGSLTAKFGSAPSQGINGYAAIRALHVDTLLLDTVYFAARQDTARMNLHAGVINAPTNPQRSFKASLTGEIRTNDAELTTRYENGKGELGMLLGVNIRPLTGGHGKGNGLAFSFTPQEPVIAFQKFRFEEGHNWLYLHKNKRAFASIDLVGPEDMAFRMHSILADTTSLQNMDIALQRIKLSDVSSVLPYFPALSGLLSAEAHYIQKEKTLVLSAEASVDELTYEHQRVGDLTLGATWLPGDNGKQYVNSYLTHDKTEVLVADGALYPREHGKDNIEVNLTLEHFPFNIANAFVPDQLLALSGDMDGELHLTGDTDHPLLNGQLVLDSVSVYARQAGARFRFDNRPVPVTNSRVLFESFALFTTSQNPFTIDGYVDFRDLSRPLANLKMQANNYTLLQAKRTRESLLYGKVLVDFHSTMRGSFSDLTLRGNMNLLGSTDVTYVMTDSPLSVQDRLNDLVTFRAFSDTTTVDKNAAPSVSLGGLNMIMAVQIDPSVRLKVDLNADRSNRVELEGGGNLTLRYTPQGDLTLTGRYTLSGGLLKYALPVIPLKEFSINNGSYVEWTGNPMDPALNFTATERLRASVGGGDNSESRMVNFDVSIGMKNRMEDLALAFDLTAPDDATVQSQLTAMGAEERNKQAIALMVTGFYLANTGSSGGLNMGSALNSVLTSQINALVGNIKNTSLSVGVEDHSNAETGDKRTDYSFRYSQRFFNDRFQIILGGKVSTGANASNSAESFIDNVSLEYRLDASSSRYVRLFYNKNYESVLEGEITETGVGLVLRKKMDRLGELFLFRRKENKYRPQKDGEQK